MEEQELEVWGVALLLKIAVITGWVVPTDARQSILVDQFQKTLIEKYPNMNVDEVEYAFRHYGTEVKDWGKEMNLSMIDQVLIPYINERKRLSHEMEERSIKPPENKIYTDDELDNISRRNVELFYQSLLNGIVPHNIKLCEYFAEILIKDELIKAGDSVHDFFMSRINANYKNIYIKDNV